jgi:NAD-dependent SIR2 family protein deacetylase
VLRLYKLHGALNWLRCPRCSHVYVNHHVNVAELIDSDEKDWITCHCGFVPLDMLLVAPSYVRNVQLPALRAIWQHAYEALRLSDRWIFVGYSLTPEDVAIRAMLLRARLAAEKLGRVPIIEVFNPDDAVAERYRSMFPNARIEASGLAGLLA